tara:strand:- start:3213 stop:3419 length:207 start_codon:yes stop_codon:yes gene_type:complete
VAKLLVASNADTQRRWEALSIKRSRFVSGPGSIVNNESLWSMALKMKMKLEQDNALEWYLVEGLEGVS